MTFKIFLKCNGFFPATKRNCRLNLPRTVFGGMGYMSVVVRLQTRAQVGCKPCIMAGFIRLTDQDINVMKATLLLGHRFVFTPFIHMQKKLLLFYTDIKNQIFRSKV